MPTDAQPRYADAKADFTGIYDQPDPRAYFRTLGGLDYRIPAHGTSVFDRLLDQMGERDDKTVLDVCCGYGVNAALLNHDVGLDDLYEHYAQVDAMSDSDQMLEIDRAWFERRRRPDAVSTVGLDIAANAVGYGAAVGLLDHGVVADLESGPPDQEVLETLATADLVTVTGGIGYVGERTFGTIVEAAGDEPPWVAALSLRWIDFTPIAETLDDLGLVTERLDGYCVPQRRFADERERQAALSGLRDRGLDPADELRLGAHCAELYVSRPPDAVRDAPIGELLGFLITD